MSCRLITGLEIGGIAIHCCTVAVSIPFRELRPRSCRRPSQREAHQEGNSKPRRENDDETHARLLARPVPHPKPRLSNCPLPLPSGMCRSNIGKSQVQMRRDVLFCRRYRINRQPNEVANSLPIQLRITGALNQASHRLEPRLQCAGLTSTPVTQA